jgi:hypothetical protein
MHKAVSISGTKNETCPKLKRVLPELVLFVSASLRASPSFRIVLAEQVQKIATSKFGRFVGLASLVNEEWKCNSGLGAKRFRVFTISKTDCSEFRSLGSKCGFVRAQLRGVFAAEDSAVVPQKDDDRRLREPQRSEADFPPLRVG